MLHADTLRSLKNLLPKGQVFTDTASLIAYEVDAGVDKGKPEGVVFPRTTAEVERVVRWSVEYGVPLVARGAGTGLSGGAVADQGGVIVEFSHMNNILDLDAVGRSVVAQPAVINLAVDEQVKLHGLYFPPDPASQRASTLGGNVAENSGGPHCFKYGVTTNYVVGMQVVLANGSSIRIGGHALDYPEYDLCGLITGSEGMLALMTAITVRLVRNPPGVKTMLAIFNSIAAAGSAVSAIIAAGLVPATLELMDQKIIGMVEPFAHAGLPLDANAVLVIDIDGYPESLDAQVQEMQHLVQQHGAYDIRTSSNAEERARIWLARKSVAGAVTRLAPSYYTVDVTVPRSRLVEVLMKVDQINERYRIRTGYLSHAGDGNLHPMMLIPDLQDAEYMQRIHKASWEMVKCCVDMGGSLTGEHGVGIEKREYMPLMHTPAELLAMWDVKHVFDPQGILNPGKMFPRPTHDNSESYAGYAHIQTNSNDKGSVSGPLFTPTTAQEAAQGLAALSKLSKQVFIIGNGGAAQTQQTLLSTCNLNGIKTYAPDDMYITVGAGTKLTDIQIFLAKDSKQVPLFSPWPDTTIGGLVATNGNAPLRMRYGAIRDLVLCGTVALPDGRTIRVGRPIVKNVAGYDLTKAFVGAYGTLGLIADITLKIVVQPRAKHTLLYPVQDLSHGLLWGRKLLPLALVASAILLCKGHELYGRNSLRPPHLPHSPYLLAYTAEGLAEDVQAELAQVREAMRNAGAPDPIEVDSYTGTDLWAALLGELPAEGAVQVRIGVPVRDLATYVQQQAATLMKGSYIADLGNGFVYATSTPETSERASAWLAALRTPALVAQGYAIVTSMPEGLQSTLDRWGYQPEGLDVMRALKKRWDPQGVLNKGVFVV